jgi:hypothetical protein
MVSTVFTSSTISRFLTTDQLAALLSVRPQSVRKRLSQTGSYHGIMARRLPNRRLLWPADAVDLFLKGGGA